MDIMIFKQKLKFASTMIDSNLRLLLTLLHSFLIKQPTNNK
jgi:hypothetical protein